MYFTRVHLQREQWRQTVAFLQQVSNSQSTILVKSTDKFAPFYWYDPGLPVTAAMSEIPAGSPDVARKLSELSTDTVIKNIYLLDYLTDITDPQREVEAVLKDLGFNLNKTYNFTGVGYIRKYIRS
jgi:hypothetical protein